MSSALSSVLALAEITERVRGTAATSGKVAIVAEYLRRFVPPAHDSSAPTSSDLASADLATAVCMLTGRAFARTDPRVLQVGGSQVRQAALEFLNIDSALLGDCARACGETAEAVGLLQRAFPERTADLTLVDIRRLFDALAAARRADQRVRLLAEALRPTHWLICKLVLKVIGGELRIGMSSLLLEQAVARAFRAELAQVRRAMLLSGDIVTVALATRAGTLEQVTHRVFSPMAMMLAGSFDPGDVLPADELPRWVYEDKFDGVRVQVHHGRRPTPPYAEPVATDLFGEPLPGIGLSDHMNTQVFSRGLDDVTESFPEIVTQLAEFPHEAVIDGEALAVRTDGTVLPFGLLQQRLGRKKVSPGLLAEVPVRLVVYDLLVLDGQLLIDRPLVERQALLRSLPWPAGVMRSAVRPLEGEPEATPTAPVVFAQKAEEYATAERVFPPVIARAYMAARDRGHEGLMLKHLDGTYEPGTRSSTWLKVKRPAATLDVVVTAAEVGHGRRQSVLSDLTFGVRVDTTTHDPVAQFVNIGKAYSGLTDREIEQMTRELNRITYRKAGRVRLVEPRIVLEVAFDSIQKSDRHKGGFALRFPRIVRWRTDKTPEQVDTLDRVRQIYEASLRVPA